MKLAIVSGLKAFKDAFQKQFNQNQYDRAVKVIEKNGYQVVEPKTAETK